MNRNRFLLLAASLVFTSGLQAQTATACLAHHPQYIPGVLETNYSLGCTGHDEPELIPLSSASGSARDLTWTVVLPTKGRSSISDVGPTFWFGGTVNDPKSLFNQAFVELQFYPDSLVSKCFNNGAFSVNFAPDTFTACSPVFKLVPNNNSAHHFTETSAFNAMLEDSTTPGSPLVMHAGNTITVHYFVTPAADGFHITVPIWPQVTPAPSFSTRLLMAP
jgi:hypothetical protein